MKSFIFIFLVSCVLIHVVSSSHHHEDTPDEYEAAHKCHLQYKLKDDEDPYELMEKNSPKTKCFAKCIYEKMGFGKDKEKPIDYEALAAKYKKDYEEEAKIYAYAAKNIDKCIEAAKSGKDDCEKAHNFAKCDWKTLEDGHK